MTIYNDKTITEDLADNLWIHDITLTEFKDSLSCYEDEWGYWELTDKEVVFLLANWNRRQYRNGKKRALAELHQPIDWDEIEHALTLDYPNDEFVQLICDIRYALEEFEATPEWNEIEQVLEGLEEAA